MQNIGTQLLPFFINVSSVSSFKNDITISCHILSTYCNIFLHNIRDEYGIIADFSRYFYEGKPLWRIHSISGTLFLNNNVLFEIINMLNTRPLLPDVKATLFHQFTFFPKDIRLKLIDNILLDEKSIDMKQNIKNIFKIQYQNEYSYLKSMNIHLFLDTHPFLYEKLYLQTHFKNEIEHEYIIRKYLSFLSIPFTFSNQYTHFLSEKYHNDIIASLFKLFEKECRLNKNEWFKYIKVHMNMFFIIQTILQKTYSQCKNWKFENNHIKNICQLWVQFLRNNNFSQSGKLKYHNI